MFGLFEVVLLEIGLKNFGVMFSYWVGSGKDDWREWPVGEEYPETIGEAIEKIKELGKKYEEQNLGLFVFVRYDLWAVLIYVIDEEEGVACVGIDSRFSGVSSHVITLHDVGSACEVLAVLELCGGSEDEFHNFLKVWLC